MVEINRPTKLTYILDEFQAPPEAKSTILRRASLVAGKGIPLKKIQAVIEKSMMVNGGIPDWPDVSATLGTRVNEYYRKLRRQP